MNTYMYTVVIGEETYNIVGRDILNYLFIGCEVYEVQGEKTLIGFVSKETLLNIYLDVNIYCLDFFLTEEGFKIDEHFVPLIDELRKVILYIDVEESRPKLKALDELLENKLVRPLRNIFGCGLRETKAIECNEIIHLFKQLCSFASYSSFGRKNFYISNLVGIPGNVKSEHKEACSKIIIEYFKSGKFLFGA